MAFWNRKKKQQVALVQEATFKDKVADFWKWYSERASYFYDTIEDGGCGDLQPEISENVNRLWGDLAWVFGPGPDEKDGHSFTLTGEGLLHRQFLTKYWLDQAPELEGWTFYSSRQPGEAGSGFSIGIGEHKFEFGSLWVSAKPDLENESVDLAAWHPLFSEVDKEVRSTVLYLILDEVLGEFGTDLWLGTIETTDTELADSMPVSELREYIHELELKEGWQKSDPTETYSLYELPEPDDEFLRSDTVTGTVRNMALINKYLNSHGEMEDELEGSGAEFVFVAFDSAVLPDGEETDFRAGIEDRLEDVLMKEKSGLILGGAIGRNLTYMDLLIFDGDRSLQLIKDELIRQELPAGTTIHFFASGNEGRRVIL